MRTRMLALLALILCTGLGSVALAQVSGGTDGNPTNPANFQTIVLEEGNDIATVVEGGRAAVYTRTWGSNPIWYRNGTPLAPGEEPVIPLHSETDSTMKSSGWITIRITWVGEGPAPPKAYFKVSSPGSYYAFNGIGDIENGLEDVLDIDPDPPGEWGRAGGSMLKFLTADSGGVYELRLQKRAEAYSYVLPDSPNAGTAVWADAHGGSAEVETRRVILRVDGNLVNFGRKLGGPPSSWEYADDNLQSPNLWYYQTATREEHTVVGSFELTEVGVWDVGLPVFSLLRRFVSESDYFPSYDPPVTKKVGYEALAGQLTNNSLFAFSEELKQQAEQGRVGESLQLPVLYPKYVCSEIITLLLGTDRTQPELKTMLNDSVDSDQVDVCVEWEDGLRARSSRVVRIHQGAEQGAVLDRLFVRQNSGAFTPFRFEGNVNWASPGEAQKNVYLQPVDWVIRYVEPYLTLKLVPMFYVKRSGTLLAALIAEALGLVVDSLIYDAVEVKAIHKAAYLAPGNQYSVPSDWRNHFAEGTSEAEAIAQMEWRVSYRCNYWIDPSVVDYWTTSGFQERAVEHQLTQTSPIDSSLFFEFRIPPGSKQ